MKKIFYLCFTLFLAVLLIGLLPVKSEAAIYDNVLRLHVIANSDSDDDQSLKLAVRDRVLSETKNIDVSDTEMFLSAALTSANEYLSENNIPYTATAQFGKFRFPQKSYNGIILPSGVYNGVRIVLGDGVGQNWWCVMYPPLCVDEKRADAQSLLKSSLSPQTYDLITKKPELRLWLLELMF